MISNTVAVMFSLCHDDEHLIDHFMKYYQSIGIVHFGCIIGYYVHGLDEENTKTEYAKLEKFYQNFIKNYPLVKVKYIPVQVNDARTATWIEILKEMSPTIKYIIPADSDELHDYIDDPDYVKKQYGIKACNPVLKQLNDVVAHLENNKLDYITSCSMERVPEDGTVKEVSAEVNIFKQFNYQNNKLFLQPKISLINRDILQLLQLGAHQISKENIEKFALKSERLSITHHFRWSKEGRIKIGKWYERHSSDEWRGWKGAAVTKKKLETFDHNLNTYDPTIN